MTVQRRQRLRADEAVARGGRGSSSARNGVPLGKPYVYRGGDRTVPEPAPQAANNPGGLCAECGYHGRSREHRVICLGETM